MLCECFINCWLVYYFTAAKMHDEFERCPMTIATTNDVAILDPIKPVVSACGWLIPCTILYYYVFASTHILAFQ